MRTAINSKFVWAETYLTKFMKVLLLLVRIICISKNVKRHSFTHSRGRETRQRKIDLNFPSKPIQFESNVNVHVIVECKKSEKAQSSAD